MTSFCDDYTELVRALDQLQGSRCAYCECDLSREGTWPHVEHFEQRSRAPHKTFEWSNLFRSCSHHERCGKYKDSLVGKYANCDLLKPDVDNPRAYLKFDSTGHVAPRQGLDDRQRRRAEETIRVFNLNAKSLVNNRLAYLRGPLAFFQLEMQEDADELEQQIAELADMYEASAFSAAILDLFGVAP